MTNARAILAALPLAFNFEAASPAPEWVQLTPPGPRIAGRDGRAWTLDAEAVALAFRETLAEPGGVLDTLAAQGYEIEGPDWKADAPDPAAP